MLAAAAAALLLLLIAAALLLLRAHRRHRRLLKPARSASSSSATAASSAADAFPVHTTDAAGEEGEMGEEDQHCGFAAEQAREKEVAQGSPIGELSVTNFVRDASPADIMINGRTAYDSPFVTGHIYLLIRTDNMDPAIASVFANKKRFFEFRFSLLIKQELKGILFLGGELPKPMKLGFAGELMCRTILTVLRQLSSSLHASFGDEKTGEPSHISFPLWYAAERLVITKAGAGPPPDIEKLSCIPESDEARSARLKDPTLGTKALTAGSIVTFSIHSQYLDFGKWKLKGIPGLKNQSLRLFWDEQPLVIALYDVANPRLPHAAPNKLHWAALLVRHGHGMNETAQLVPNTPLTKRIGASPALIPSVLDMDEDALEADGESEDDDDDDDDEPMSTPASSSPLKLKRLASSRKRRVSWPAAITLLFRSTSPRLVRYLGPVSVPAILNDAAFVLQHKSPQSGTEAFSLVAFASLVSVVSKMDGFSSGTPPPLRSLADALAWRRFLNAELSSHAASGEILLPQGVPLLSHRKRTASPRSSSLSEFKAGFEAQVLRAVTEDLWIEEHVVLAITPGSGKARLMFFNRGETKVASRVVHVNARMEVNKMPRTMFGLEGLVLSATMREDVLLLDKADELKALLEEYIRSSTDDVDGVFVDETMRWGAQRRIVLNTRALRLQGASRASGEQVSIADHVATLLRLASDVVSDRSGAGGDSSLPEPAALGRFLSSASVLRYLDFEKWSRERDREEALAVMLNLYHCMLLHARWLIGPPTSVFRWSAFGSQASYELGWGSGFGVLSLAEIEHGVIRGNPPRLFADFMGGVQTKPVPASVFSDALKLSNREPRINFALNHGCRTELSFVPIYAPATLDNQLNQVCELFLEQGVRVDKNKILLPRIMYWYFVDFLGPKADSADAVKLANAILPLMSEKARAKVQAQLPRTEVRFAKFNWDPVDVLSVRGDW